MSEKVDIGYAIITTAEYRAIIEDNYNKENCIKELNEVAFKRNIINEKLEKYFFNRLSDSKSYHLENMEECTPSDYNYQELYKCFLEIGIDDTQYIHTSIMTLKHNFDNKKSKKEKKEDVK